MTPKLLAALLGGIGGLILGAAGGLSFLARESLDWHGTLTFTGYAVTVAALLVTGYGLVASAPVWLRTIVSVAFPLFIASVWQVIDQAIDDRIHGWKGPASVHLLAGVIVMAIALLGFRRLAGGGNRGYQPSHR